MGLVSGTWAWRDKKMDVDRDSLWWYCLRHNQPEQGPGCPDTERLGPYPSKELAEQALNKAAQRTKEWEEDPRWNDERDEDADR